MDELSIAQKKLLAQQLPKVLRHVPAKEYDSRTMFLWEAQERFEWVDTDKTITDREWWCVMHEAFVALPEKDKNTCVRLLMDFVEPWNSNAVEFAANDSVACLKATLPQLYSAWFTVVP